MEGLYRFAEFNDGTTTIKLNVEEALNLTHSTECFGGYSTIRTLDGAGVKVFNWKKKKLSISASGAYVSTLHDLNYTVPITVKWGAKEATTVTSLLAILPPHRTDTGYSPVYYSLVNGLRVKYNGSNPSASYIVEYYPIFTALFAPPSVTKTEDNALGYALTLSGEEV